MWSLFILAMLLSIAVNYRFMTEPSTLVPDIFCASLYYIFAVVFVVFREIDKRRNGEDNT